MRRARLFHASAIGAALAFAGAAGMVAAQSTDTIDTNEPIDTSGSYQVDGVQVDVTGPNADAARYAGWRVAQRTGYRMLAKKMGAGGGVPSDAVLDSMVTGIVIENEQIGPNRYIARLGVLFSRGKIGGMLGLAGQDTRSSPMLLIPVQWSGGAAVAFEQKTAWADAWGRFRTGDSSVDYVRPIGSGPDSLLLNEGQVGRRDRGWWRSVLDQYAASDILTPVVTLSRQWPGGPVIGAFEARHGADNHLIGRFTLRVESEDGLSALLDAGVKRLDALYATALKAGALAGDPSLAYIPPPMPTPTPTPVDTPTVVPTTTTEPPQTGAAAMTIQFDTPTAGSVSSIESAVRGIPGVSGAATTSMAIGGLSVMRLSYSGDPEVLRASLQSRGFQVAGSGTTLRIRRPEANPGE